MRPQFAFPRITKVVRRLLVANVAIFLAFFVLWLASSDGGGLYATMRDILGLAPERWKLWSPWFPIWQLLTYGFLHSVVDFGHVLFNMLALYFFGTMLEERLGSRRFLLTYLAAQVAGGVLFLLPAAFGHLSGPVVGASGAVLGVTVAVATLYPRQIVFFIVFPIPLMWLAVALVGLDFFGALVSFKQGSDGVAHLAHLGGAIYGFLAVKLGLIQKDPIELFERKRAVAEVERAADDEARMDKLLEKIHREGMGSLSRSEKDFLKRMSSRR
jgi:membrane associated rhomboid family serine protease